jgi:hypothetical protein
MLGLSHQSSADQSNPQSWHDHHPRLSILRIATECGSVSMIAHPRVNYAMFTNVTLVSLSGDKSVQ